MEPDRAWLLTPPGPGAIAVIRFSGVGAIQTLQRRFSKKLIVGGCVHGELRDAFGTVIDDPVVVLLDDRTADVNLHGGGAIVRAVLAFAEQSGLRIQPPPLDSASPDVIHKEMVAALSLPHTHLGLQALLAQPQAWKSTKWSAARVAAALSDEALHWLLQPPKVAIVGLPNAGKSTLANQLFGQQRSIVFDLPGTTRDWVGDYADVFGLPVMLIDTPGIRRTLDPIEAAAIRRSYEQMRAADLVVFVLDLTQPQPPQVVLLHDEFPRALRVVNKADLRPLWSVGDPGVYHTVAATGQGVDDVRWAIRRHFLGDEFDPSLARIWTQRQRELLLQMQRLNA